MRASAALAGLKVPGDEQIGVDIIRRACEEPAIQNAASISALMLTTEAMICEKRSRPWAAAGWTPNQ